MLERKSKVAQSSDTSSEYSPASPAVCGAEVSWAKGSGGCRSSQLVLQRLPAEETVMHHSSQAPWWKWALTEGRKRKKRCLFLQHAKYIEVGDVDDREKKWKMVEPICIPLFYHEMVKIFCIFIHTVIDAFSSHSGCYAVFSAPSHIRAHIYISNI